MRFHETPVPGAWLIELEPHADARGLFARTYCAREFAEQGIRFEVAQCNLSVNHRRGTLRGLHYQAPPSAEAKVVRCVRGAIHDVIVDLRPDSPAYRRHYAVDLSAENRLALFVPELCAHGFQTMTDGAEVSYLMGEFYDPDAQRGVRWDDPAFAIPWPLAVTEISEKDASWPLVE